MKLGIIGFHGFAPAWRCLRLVVVACCLLPVVLRGAAAGSPPASSPASSFDLVDLSGLTAAVSNATALPGWSAFPLGTRPFNGVPFKVAGRLPVTGLDDARDGNFYPPQAGLIRLGRKADRVHLLLGIQHDDKVGVPIAKVVFRYASGAERSYRLAYGVHVLSWMKDRKAKGNAVLDVESKLAWSNGEETERPGSSVRLFQTVLDNPLPGEVIERVEWNSLFSRGTPFLAGITLESTGGSGLVRRPELTRRAARKSLELKETVYRDELVIRVRDERTAGVPPKASAALTITDDESTFFFGTAEADSSGTIRLPFPPQQTVGFDVLVRAPGHLPAMFSGSVTNGGAIPRVLEASLVAGVNIGGVVRDPAGKPVGGALVNIHRVLPRPPIDGSKAAPREYTRIDYDLAVTARDGRWTSGSVPAELTNFSFHVSHPEQRPALFVQSEADRSDGNLVTREALLAGKAVMLLPPPLRIAGTVTDPAGKPVAKAEVRLMEGAKSDRPAICDAEGRFSLMAEQPGEVSLVAQAPGYATRVQSLRVDTGMAPIQVRLAKAQPFRGTVVDQYQVPVVGARIRYDPSNNARSYLWQTLTDESGRFVWESPPESDVMLYISATNYSSTRMSFSGSGGDHRIQLRRQSRIYGRVVDAATRKPLEEFQVTRGRSYNYDEPIRWDRYDPIRGRKGDFSVRLEEYSSSGQSQVLVEAPGYMPVASPVYRKAGVYTNLFEMKTGRGIGGVVLWSDGTPAAGVTVALVDSGESVGMERPGELRRGNSGPAFQRSNGGGRFEFPPKYDPHTVLAADERGFAQVPVSNLLATGKIVLQPWGQIKGVVRVGRQPEPGQAVMLQSGARFAETGRSSAALALSIRTDPDAEGNFVFNKVPPGERTVSLQYMLSDSKSGRIALSHGVPVAVEPSATAEVVIGGTGRPVKGRIVPVGADPEDLDWRRDVNTLTSILTLPPSIGSPVFRAGMSDEERQQSMRDYNERQAAFWRTPEGRKMQREQRSYVLLFDTNGAFRVENVDPGQYWIYAHITNPDRGNNYYETIGSQSFNVTVPPAPAAGSAEPLDLGEFKLPIRGMLRLGRRAPPLETQTVDGKPMKLADFKGKYVLLDFWASWSGSRTYDVRILKEIHETYGKDERFVLVGLNFDQERAQAERAIQESGFKWLQCYVGAWETTQIPASFGIQGLPEAVLVDPEGKIVGRGLRGASIRTTVRNYLSEPRTSAKP